MIGFLALAAVVLAAFRLPLLTTVRALRRADLQVGSRVSVPAERVPDAARAALDRAAAELARLGFALCSWEHVQPFVRERGVDTWGATFRNETWRSFAVLTTPATPAPRRPPNLWFWSLLRDGSRVLTTNGDGWAAVGEDGRTEAHDAGVHTLAAHCDAHFERLRALPRERYPVRASYPALVDGTREDARRRIDRLVAAGDLIETREGRWRLGWRGALRWARILRSRARP